MSIEINGQKYNISLEDNSDSPFERIVVENATVDKNSIIINAKFINRKDSNELIKFDDRMIGKYDIKTSEVDCEIILPTSEISEIGSMTSLYIPLVTFQAGNNHELSIINSKFTYKSVENYLYLFKEDLHNVIKDYVEGYFKSSFDRDIHLELDVNAEKVN